MPGLVSTRDKVRQLKFKEIFSKFRFSAADDGDDGDDGGDGDGDGGGGGGLVVSVYRLSV